MHLRRIAFVLMALVVFGSLVGCKKLFGRRPVHGYDAGAYPTAGTAGTASRTGGFDAGVPSTGGSESDTAYKKALSLNESACLGGDMSKCNDLGINYEEGQGTPVDFLRAGDYYKKACDGKTADGCANLGALYDDGKG